MKNKKTITLCVEWEEPDWNDPDCEYSHEDWENLPEEVEVPADINLDEDCDDIIYYLAEHYNGFLAASVYEAE